MQLVYFRFPIFSARNPPCLIHIKTVGIFMLLLLAAICFLIAKIFFPEFYSNTITLTLAGDVDSLSRYISSFGYGAFAVSLFY